MEILIACAVAWVMGAQVEDDRLGISPAQRKLMKEQTRHERAIEKINNSGDEKPGTAGTGRPVPKMTTQPTMPGPSSVPEAFRSGYTSVPPLVRRVATPSGRYAGAGVAHTVRALGWVKDTGKSALAEYRKRRIAQGDPDPAPVVVPPRPAYPPMPSAPPVQTEPAGPVEQQTARPADGTSGSPVRPYQAPSQDGPEESPTDVLPDLLRWPGEQLNGPPDDTPDPAPLPDTDTPSSQGSSYMAPEVNYYSVKEESDEMVNMCADELTVYERIGRSAEREISKGDALIADLDNYGLHRLMAKVARCKEQYQVIHAGVEGMKSDTRAQSEAVTMARDKLVHGQGLHASVGRDMGDELANDRAFYTEDSVDADDVNAEAETFGEVRA